MCIYDYICICIRVYVYVYICKSLSLSLFLSLSFALSFSLSRSLYSARRSARRFSQARRCEVRSSVNSVSMLRDYPKAVPKGMNTYTYIQIYIYIYYLMVILTWITVVIRELIHAPKPDFLEGLCLLVTKPTDAPPGLVAIHSNRTNRMALPAMNYSSF